MKINTLILLVAITTFAFIRCEKDDSTNYSRVEKIRELAQKSKNDFDTEIIKIGNVAGLIWWGASYLTLAGVVTYC